MRENCGVVAAIDLKDNRDVAPLVRDMLPRLQHRGQLSAGLTSLGIQNQLTSVRGAGLVKDVFKTEFPDRAAKIIRQLTGSRAIGHVRYATSGDDAATLAQPFVHLGNTPNQRFAFGFNGNIANYDDLLHELLENGHELDHVVDTEILRHLLAIQHKTKNQVQLTKVFKSLQSQVDGAFNIVYLNERGDLAAYRDQHGFRPLCYGIRDNILYVASEDFALHTVMGSENIEEIQPGQLLTVDGKTREFKLDQIVEAKPRRCVLEYLYFSHVASTFDGRSIYATRIAAGKKLTLADHETLDDDCVVVAIPDSARTVAKGFADFIGVSNAEGVMSNRYSGRTFIEDEKTREKKKKQKYEILREVVEGKKVFLMDDSLIRGETLRYVIDLLKKHGHPKEIHVRIGCPPVSNPCFYGIDIPTTNELFTRQFGIEGITSGELPEAVLKQMAKNLGVNSLKYLPVESLVESIGIDTNELCMACIKGRGRYPTEAGEKNYAKVQFSRTT